MRSGGGLALRDAEQKRLKTVGQAYMTSENGNQSSIYGMGGTGDMDTMMKMVNQISMESWLLHVWMSRKMRNCPRLTRDQEEDAAQGGSDNVD